MCRRDHYCTLVDLFVALEDVVACSLRSAGRSISTTVCSKYRITSDLLVFLLKDIYIYFIIFTSQK